MESYQIFVSDVHQKWQLCILPVLEYRLSFYRHMFFNWRYRGTNFKYHAHYYYIAFVKSLLHILHNKKLPFMEVKNSVYFEHNRKEQKVYYALMALPLICNMNATQCLHREMYSNSVSWSTVKCSIILPNKSLNP